MLANFLTNASGILFSWRDSSSFRCYTLGQLCLCQCIFISCYPIVSSHNGVENVKVLNVGDNNLNSFKAPNADEINFVGNPLSSAEVVLTDDETELNSNALCCDFSWVNLAKLKLYVQIETTKISLQKKTLNSIFL